MTLLPTVAVIIGVIVGSGIFSAPSGVAAATHSATASLMVWIVGGLLTLCLALCVAELGTMFPQAGGAFVYLNESFGPATAFAYGWTYLLLLTPSAWAAGSLIFGRYLGAFIALDDTGVRIAATVLISVVTIANVVSLRAAAGIQTLATSAKVFALAAIVGVLFGFGGGTHEVAVSSPAQGLTVGGFVVGLVIALWAYDGVVPASSLFGEVRDPSRNLPRALILGVLAVMVIYVGMNAAVLHVLPIEAIASSDQVAADAMRSIAGDVGASLIAGAVMLSVFGAMVAAVMCDPRVVFAMAREQLFFSAVGAVHPRFETPYVAILLCGALSVAWVWVRTFEQLAAQLVLGLWPFFVLMILGLIRLRWQRPQIDRPYRVPFYPLVPVAFLAASAVMLAASFIELREVTLINLTVIVAAFPIYFIWKQFSR